MAYVEEVLAELTIEADVAQAQDKWLKSVLAEDTQSKQAHAPGEDGQALAKWRSHHVNPEDPRLSAAAIRADRDGGFDLGEATRWSRHSGRRQQHR